MDHYREDERADALYDVRTTVRLHNDIEIHDDSLVILVVRRTSHLLLRFDIFRNLQVTPQAYTLDKQPILEAPPTLG